MEAGSRRERGCAAACVRAEQRYRWGGQEAPEAPVRGTEPLFAGVVDVVRAAVHRRLAEADNAAAAAQHEVLAAHRDGRRVAIRPQVGAIGAQVDQHEAFALELDARMFAGDETAHVSLTYMTDMGEQQGPEFDLGARSRQSVNVSETVQTYDVSTEVDSDRPVVVERALYYNNRQCATGSVGFDAW